MEIINMTLKKQIEYFGLAIGFGISLLSIELVAMAGSGKLSAEQVIERIFRSDTPLPGSTAAKHQNVLKFRSELVGWLGSYQGVRAEKGRYVMLFERGSIPATVMFKEDGNPGGIGMSECPTTSVPIGQAPSEYRQFLSACPNLKR
jgi:hypothetical protein